MAFETIEEINLSLAKRFKELRRKKEISQEQLSIMSKVSYGTIKRFESKGEISLYSLTKLCVALNMEFEIRNLFNKVKI